LVARPHITPPCAYTTLFRSFNKQQVQNANYLASTPGSMVNQPIDVLDAWTSPGDQTDTQAFTTGANYERSIASYYFRQSDAAFRDRKSTRLNSSPEKIQYAV